MDYKCRIVSLGNSFTASGSSNPGETVLTRDTVRSSVVFVTTVLISIFTIFCLPSSSVSFSYFNLTVPCTSVRENTRA